MMKSDPAMRTAAALRTPSCDTACASCAASMPCGAAEKSCWCQSLPDLPASQLSTESACLCPACLKTELKKNMMLFGIANCDTVKKARAQLTAAGTAHVFWDFKKYGVPSDWLDEWVSVLGFEVLLNKRGTTWRQLGDAAQALIVDAASAKAAMLANPSIIKRPVVAHNAHVRIGL